MKVEAALLPNAAPKQRDRLQVLVHPTKWHNHATTPTISNLDRDTTAGFGMASYDVHSLFDIVLCADTRARDSETRLRSAQNSDIESRNGSWTIRERDVCNGLLTAPIDEMLSSKSDH